MKRLAVWLSENKNERMWFLLAFIIFLIVVYSFAFASDRSRGGECVDKGTCPDEWEMRGGDTW